MHRQINNINPDSLYNDFTISVVGSSIFCSETARNLLVIFVIALAVQLIYDLIPSRIDYCNPILYVMTDSVISDLQNIQNAAARILEKCGTSFIHSSYLK